MRFDDVWSLELPILIELENLAPGAEFYRRAVAHTHGEAAEYLEMWSLLAVCFHIMNDVHYTVHGPVPIEKTEYLQAVLLKVQTIISGPNWLSAVKKS